MFYWPIFSPAIQPKQVCTPSKDDIAPDTEPSPKIAPNGTDGYICLGCHVFCAYVKPNCKDGYKCPDCR